MQASILNSIAFISFLSFAKQCKTCRGISANIPGNYQIAAVSVKGGVGKTRVTAAVGSVFAEFRGQPVIAIDANPTYGGLGRLIDPRTQTSVRDFLAAEVLVDYPKARFYTGRNKQGLEVLAGNQNVANPMALEAKTFTATISLSSFSSRSKAYPRRWARR